MVELTGKRMIFLFTVVFPLLFLAAAILLGSGVCIVLPLIVWIGIAIIMMYLPTSTKE
jgi:hypothetical protein